MNLLHLHQKENLFLSSNNLRRIFCNRPNRVHNTYPPLCIKQIYKTDRFVKKRFLQLGNIFHISVLFNMINDLMNKGDLLLIQ